MFLSVFDIFKIGVGPSSSHTMGPMLAASRFMDDVAALPLPAGDLSVSASLYGSLAYTGEGHGTFRAVLCGLVGMTPKSYEREDAERRLTDLQQIKRVRAGLRTLRLDPDAAIIAERGQRLAEHPNGMTFRVVDEAGATVHAETYYSVGGGFVMTADEMAADRAETGGPVVPYPFANAAEMLKMGERAGLSIAQMKRANELARRETGELEDGIATIWRTMDRCIEAGLATDGVLPGGLGVKRRAAGLKVKLDATRGANDAPLHTAIDWL